METDGGRLVNTDNKHQSEGNYKESFVVGVQDHTLSFPLWGDDVDKEALEI